MGFLGDLFGKKKNTAKDGNTTVPENASGSSGEEKDRTGGFVGFILLKEARWDKAETFRVLRETWGITPDLVGEDREKEEDTMAVFWVGGIMCALSLMPAPVPNGEAEHYAAANFFWKEAVEVTKTHTAHILVSVLGNKKDPVGAGKLFTAITASCLTQPEALGVYTSGTVLAPDYYLRVAGDMKNGDLPVMDWIYVGIYRGKKGICGYTYGLATFGREEMEILDSSHQAGDIFEFLYDLCLYMLKSDAYIRDGETVGHSEEEKLPVTRSKGVSLEGMTLKIQY